MVPWKPPRLYAKIGDKRQRMDWGSKAWREKLKTVPLPSDAQRPHPEGLLPSDLDNGDTGLDSYNESDGDTDIRGTVRKKRQKATLDDLEALERRWDDVIESAADALNCVVAQPCHDGCGCTMKTWSLLTIGGSSGRMRSKMISTASLMVLMVLIARLRVSDFQLC